MSTVAGSVQLVIYTLNNSSCLKAARENPGLNGVSDRGELTQLRYKQLEV